MPWTGKSFRKHSREAQKSSKAARGAAQGANQALASGKSEGAAVRIGNYVARRVRSANRKRKTRRK